MDPSKEEIRKRIRSLINEVPKRGLERHASIEKEVNDLPEELRSGSLFQLIKNEKIEKIIVFPQQIQRGWNYIPKQALIFTETGVIHSLASIWPETEPKITFIKGCDLVYLEITLILLYGSLLIVADGTGTQAQIEVEFNTVAWDQLSEPLYRFFHTKEKHLDQSGIASSHERVSPAKNDLPIKFSNGIRIYGLLKNERLEGYVFQPETSRQWLFLFRKPMIANTMLLLTSNYLVIMREELNVNQGWILTYLPRNNISEIRQRSTGLCQEVNIHLKYKGISAEYGIQVSNETATKWRENWGQSIGGWEIMTDEEAQGNKE